LIVAWATPPHLVGTTNTLAAAVAAGNLTPGESANVSALVAIVGKAIELGEIKEPPRSP